MIARWSISILIFAITLFGIASQQQIPQPNQEIVLQFAGHAVSTNETDAAITLVKRQLLSIGVVNIQIQEQKAGRLVITYFSESDIASVKKILSEEKQETFGYACNNRHKNHSKLPFDEQSGTYNVDVYEIQNTHDVEFHAIGNNALKDTSEHNFLYSSNLLTIIYTLFVSDFNVFIKEDYKFRKDIALVINNTSYIIPEVRAGPIL